jgi:DNA mismatch repair protein MutS2
MFDDRTLAHLEYGKIKKILARYTVSELGRQQVRALVPQSDPEMFGPELQKTAELVRAITDQGGLQLAGLADITAELKLLGVEGSVLEPGQLIKLKDFLAVVAQARKYLKQARGTMPLIDEEIGLKLTELPDLVQHLDRVFDEKGEVRENASSELARIMDDYRAAHRKLESTLGKIVHALSPAEVLQEDYFTIRNERLVVPVKIEQKGRVQGVIHDRSDSGATVFIEPLETVELNNQLKDLRLAERTEKRRLMREISETGRKHLAQLEEDLHLTARLEFLCAKARMAADFNAVVPVFTPRIKLRQARHPLLMVTVKSEDADMIDCRIDASAVVPLDLEFSERFTTLVITGPNAGGKTVAIKTAGLLTLMAQSGLLVPAAEGTELKAVDSVFADIGDEQSIQHNLSTFSSHLAQIKKMLENVTPHSLVLVDELCTGTDPDLGIALAMAVLEFLTSKQVLSIITTHHSALKVFAHHRENIANGSMEFDEANLKPTYRFRAAIPGASYTFEIAERVGLPGVVLQRARSFIRADTKRVEDLIGELDKNVRAYRERVLETESKNRDLKRLTDEYEARLAASKQEARKMVADAYLKSQQILEDAQKLMEKTVTDIKTGQASRQTIVTARQDLGQARVHVEQKRQTYVPTAERGPNLKALEKAEVGKKVWIVAFSKEGVIASFSGDQEKVTVRVNDKMIQVPRQGLKEFAPGPALAPAPPAPPPPPVRDVHAEVDMQGMGMEINVIGQTVYQALENVDRYLDKAGLANLRIVRIIHGAGTGILRQRIGEMLRKNVHVAQFRPAEINEGGGGVTVVELK